MQETRTAGIAADYLRAAGYEVTPGVGKTGVVGLLRNGDGPVADAFRQHFPADRVQETKPTTASEDFGSFGTEWGVPSVFWFVGGIDADMYAKAKKEGRMGDIPTNHNPRFAPVIHPTLETGVEALAVAAQAWLAA